MQAMGCAQVRTADLISAALIVPARCGAAVLGLLQRWQPGAGKQRRRASAASALRTALFANRGA